MIRLTKTSKTDLKALSKDIERRIANVGREVGRAVAERVAEEVRKRLAGRGEWPEIYRDAIIYKESAEGDKWAIAGLSDRSELFEFPAENSLLYFAGNGMGQYPALHNPWPLDVIPALTSGYDDTARIEMHDPSTVETYRQARLLNVPGVINALKAAGGNVDPTGETLVMIARVYADIKYMARRLELGFNGYPRIPHWAPAAALAASQGKNWATTPTVLRLVKSALKGGKPVEVAKMTASQADEFARIREATWS